MTGFKNSRKKGEGEQSITLTCNCHLHMLKALLRPFFLLELLLGFLTLVPSPKGSCTARSCSVSFPHLCFIPFLRACACTKLWLPLFGTICLRHHVVLLSRAGDAGLCVP